jgi:hypothetical protein
MERWAGHGTGRWRREEIARVGKDGELVAVLVEDVESPAERGDLFEIAAGDLDNGINDTFGRLQAPFSVGREYSKIGFFPAGTVSGRASGHCVF